MKAFKITMIVSNLDDVSKAEAKEIIESDMYPNHCFYPEVTEIEEVSVGRWHDRHPLNQSPLPARIVSKYFPQRRRMRFSCPVCGEVTERRLRVKSQHRPQCDHCGGNTVPIKGR